MATPSETIALSHAEGAGEEGGYGCGVARAGDSAAAAGKGIGAFDWIRMHHHRHHQLVRSASQCSMTTSSKRDSLDHCDDTVWHYQSLSLLSTLRVLLLLKHLLMNFFFI